LTYSLSSVEHSFIENEVENQIEKNIARHENFKNKNIDIEDVYCCDWYPLYKTTPDDPQYEVYLEEKEYWLDLFANVEDSKIQKGIIKIKL
jgi:hypothetical protein